MRYILSSNLIFPFLYKKNVLTDNKTFRINQVPHWQTISRYILHMYDWVDSTRKNEWRIYDQRQHLVQGKLKERMAI